MNATSLRHILSFLLILLLAGCGTPAERQVRQTLRCAEEVLAERPDSALTLLTPLDTMSLAGEEQAWYAVLRTQADYKLYHPLTTDSLPLLATAYYGTPRRPHYRAAMAWYSLGCVYTELKDDPRAIDAYLKARDLFPDTLCRYYALTEQNLGKHYLNRHDYSDAIRTLHYFKGNASALSDTSLVGYADYFLGKAYMMNADYEKATDYFLKVLGNDNFMAQEKIDTYFQLAKVKHQQGLNDDAKTYVGLYLERAPKYPPRCATYYLKGDIFYSESAYDSAHYYYRKALEGCNDLFTLCCTYEKLTKLASIYDTDSLESYSDKHTLYRDSIYNNARTAEVEQVQINHELISKLNQQRFTLRTISIVSLFALLVITAALYCFLKKKRINKRRMSVACEMSREEMVLYCQEQYQSSEWSDILSKIQYNADLQKMSLLKRKEFTKYVHELMGNIEIDLQSTNPTLTRDDVFVCCLILPGLSVSQIEHCTDYSKHAIYCRKTRITGKLDIEWEAILHHLTSYKTKD